MWPKLKSMQTETGRLCALQKYSSPLAFSLFCGITTCNLNGFLFGFHVMDVHKMVQIGEVKWKILHVSKSCEVQIRVGLKNMYQKLGTSHRAPLNPLYKCLKDMAPQQTCQERAAHQNSQTRQGGHESETKDNPEGAAELHSGDWNISP
jgi:hypothetical protein